MSECSAMDGSYPSCSFHSYSEQRFPEQSHQTTAQWRPSTGEHPSLPTHESPALLQTSNELTPAAPKAETPRELRNRAEKQRRNNMSQSITRLASIVPPVAKAGKKVDKTSVLRFTAHYLRSYRHVFGKSLDHGPTFSLNFAHTILQTMKGFLLTITYKGLVVVASPNIQQYLGYTELELLGQNVFNIVHKDDHQLLLEQLYPRCCKLTCNGELLLSKDENDAKNVAEALKNETRAFLIRFKKQTHLRSDPVQYLTCHIEGSFRKSDRAGVYVNSNVQIGRRVRARGKNPFASGNDIVFIGMVRPITETFATERRIEAFRMEYRTRHSIDGSIIECEQRIALVTGYMVHEVKGVNAMNFMHRDDVRCVIVALRQMYVKHRRMGESCYRLMTKNGQFIYMRTQGTLDVDPVSKEATSFVCTNTVVPEQEGIRLIKLMKQKFSNEINDDKHMTKNGVNLKVTEKQTLSVEDPKQLEKVIYRLVTDLPSLQTNQNNSKETNTDLAIIPPKKEQIKKAIEKSYSVIKTLKQLAPKTQLEKIISKESQYGSLETANTPNSQYSEPMPDIIQHLNQNPSQNGYHPQKDYSRANIPSTSGYPANSTVEECEQRVFNEVEATLRQCELNGNLARFNNPNVEGLYGTAVITYREENGNIFQTEVAGNSNFCCLQNPPNNDEENLQRWLTKETTDSNGMNLLANQFSEAARTLNSECNDSWTTHNQEFSTLPGNNLDVPSTHDIQTPNYNVHVNGVENLEFSLSPTMQQFVDGVLKDGDLFQTADLTSQSFMNEAAFSTEYVDRSYEMDVDKMYEILAELNQIEGIDQVINESDTLRGGLPVATENSAAYTAHTQQNNYYLQQPAELNQYTILDPYEFNVEEDPVGLTRQFSYMHAGEPPSSEQ